MNKADHSGGPSESTGRSFISHTSPHGVISWVAGIDGEGWRLRGGFTTRHGGVSTGSYSTLNLGLHVDDDAQAVEGNRRILAAELGCEPAWMEQVHGAEIAVAIPGETAAHTDGLVLDVPRSGSAAACVMVADCVPLILLGHEGRGAVVHVGRAGLLSCIAERAISELGTDVVAMIGPSICGKCYEVPDEMAEEAEAQIPAAQACTSWGTPSIDIPRALEGQLSRAGVRDIRRDGRCTYEDADFYSHRRASLMGLAPTGRFAGIVYAERLG